MNRKIPDSVGTTSSVRRTRLIPPITPLLEIDRARQSAVSIPWSVDLFEEQRPEPKGSVRLMRLYQPSTSPGCRAPLCFQRAD